MPMRLLFLLATAAAVAAQPAGAAGKGAGARGSGGGGDGGGIVPPSIMDLEADWMDAVPLRDTPTVNNFVSPALPPQLCNEHVRHLRDCFFDETRAAVELTWVEQPWVSVGRRRAAARHDLAGLPGFHPVQRQQCAACCAHRGCFGPHQLSASPAIVSPSSVCMRASTYHSECGGSTRLLLGVRG